MKQPRELRVLQIRVFETDVLGYASFRVQQALHEIRSRYGFGTAPGPDLAVSAPLLFAFGKFVHDGTDYLINTLIIEDRRVLLDLTAGSEVCSAFFEDLREVLCGLDLRKPSTPYEPMLRVEETTCVAEFDFELDQLLSNPLREFAGDLNAAVQLQDTSVLLVPSIIRFSIRYMDVAEELKRHQVSLLDKDFRIELRANTDPADRVYFTHSPLDSDTHLRLVRDLEQAIVKKR